MTEPALAIGAHEETRPLHVESSHHAPDTLRQFLKQYAMVVLSILTALGLERGAVALHNRSAARESRVQIEAELARNAIDLAQTRHDNADSIKRAKAALKLLISQLRTPQPDLARLQAEVSPALTTFDISAPSWQHQAWDTALADQSAGNLSVADMNRYRLIYATQRDVESSTLLLLGGEWLTQATNLALDTQLGRFDARQAAGVLARYLLVLQQIKEGEDKLAALLNDLSAAPTTTRSR